MTTEEEEVIATHDIFWQGLANRDLEKRFSVCADDVTFFGTGHHEHAVGKEQYREMNEIGKLQYPAPFEIHIEWIKVRVIRHVACVECDTIWIKDKKGKPEKDFLRLTTILKKKPQMGGDSCAWFRTRLPLASRRVRYQRTNL